jgi:hypothetical protein
MATREAPGFSHFEAVGQDRAKWQVLASIGKIGHDQVDAVGFEPRPGHVAVNELIIGAVGQAPRRVDLFLPLPCQFGLGDQGLRGPRFKLAALSFSMDCSRIDRFLANSM